MLVMIVGVVGLIAVVALRTRGARATLGARASLASRQHGPLNAAVDDDVREQALLLLDRGEKIAAIKLLHEQADLGLREARDFVAHLEHTTTFVRDDDDSPARPAHDEYAEHQARSGWDERPAERSGWDDAPARSAHASWDERPAAGGGWDDRPAPASYDSGSSSSYDSGSSSSYDSGSSSSSDSSSSSSSDY